MDYMAKYYKNLCEQLSSDMTRLLADLDARIKARENDPNFQRIANASFYARRQRQLNDYKIPNKVASASLQLNRRSRELARGNPLTQPHHELQAFYELEPEKQEKLIPTLSSVSLERLQKAQYERSKSILAGEEDTKLNPQSVAAQNLISKTLTQRRENPMGGSAAARTYVERAKTQALPSSFSSRELQAISNEAEKEGKAQFTAGQKTISPGTYAAIQNIEAAQKARREKDAQETASLMASREANAKRMYGDQWMKYV